jgi:serine protease Do
MGFTRNVRLPPVCRPVVVYRCVYPGAGPLYMVARGGSVRRWDWLVAAFVGVLVGAGIVWRWVETRPPAPTVWPVVAIARKVDPSVVAVVNLIRAEGRWKARGLGTGVILGADGVIVTNYHVVAGASAVEVVLHTGRRLPARIVGVDPPTDLAVLRVSAQGLKPLPLANSDAVQPGELVVAIGHPLGLSHTVTAGIVSARDRVLYRDGWEYHLIQTDAAINPGNSGGPLVNQDGALIGINSSKIAQLGTEGLGFAIPSNTVRTVVRQILLYGHVRRPWLGLKVAEAPNMGAGLLIVAVDPGSPAAQAGIRRGDFLYAFNGRRVERAAQLVQWVQNEPVGQVVRLTLLREARTFSVTVRLADRASETTAVGAGF